jgi:hypothetical protein
VRNYEKNEKNRKRAKKALRKLQKRGKLFFATIQQYMGGGQ